MPEDERNESVHIAIRNPAAEPGDVQCGSCARSPLLCRCLAADFPPMTKVDPRPVGPAEYFRRWRGKQLWGPPPKVFWVAFWGLLGSLVSLSIIGTISRYALEPEGRQTMLAFNGASAAIIFGLPSLPSGQPRNMLAGHFIGALTAIAVCEVLPGQDVYWLAAAISVGVAVFVMELTGTINPPAGAIALLYCAVPSVRAQRWNYLWIVELDAAIMVATALCLNNLARFHRYPQYWL